MAQTNLLQRRIRSVKNAKQITKALEVVAASRMRRVVQLVEGSRLYGELAAAVMAQVADNPEARSEPFFNLPPDKPTLYIILTSDRGQAGAFNSNVFHLATGTIKEDKQRAQLIIFGRKGTAFFSRLRDVDLRGIYENIADIPEVNVFAPVTEMVIAGLRAGEFSQVVLIYTQFLSSLSQKASAVSLFPVGPDAIQTEQTDAKTSAVFEFEPDISNVIDEGIRLYLEARLMQAKIESAASEQAMRMVAMGNASRNASDLIDNLTLELNATRQASITQEIAEITGGAAAIAEQ